MYEEKVITELVEQAIEDKTTYLVEVKVSKTNNIAVFIDNNNGVTIEECVEISKHIESSLDRETEDFELEVSSAGIGYPFKVEKQYLKNIGKEVEVVLNSGEKINGILKAFNGDAIDFEYSKMVKLEGKKRKQLVTEVLILKLENIKSTKEILSL